MLRRAGVLDVSTRCANERTPPLWLATVDYDGTFDSRRIFGCVCDSTWPVGLGDAEVQEAEWFGE